MRKKWRKCKSKKDCKKLKRDRKTKIIIWILHITRRKKSKRKRSWRIYLNKNSSKLTKRAMLIKRFKWMFQDLNILISEYRTILKTIRIISRISKLSNISLTFLRNSNNRLTYNSHRYSTLMNLATLIWTTSSMSII